MGFPDGSVVRNLPAMQEMQEMRVWSLGWEDTLEEDMATHPSILAWRIPCKAYIGLQRARLNWSNWAHNIKWFIIVVLTHIYLMINDFWVLFHVLSDHSSAFFGKVSVQVFVILTLDCLPFIAGIYIPDSSSLIYVLYLDAFWLIKKF